MTITNTSNVLPPSNDDYNGWADFWHYKIGVNVIPADTKNKKPIVEWAQYQDNPISEWQHEKWKSENAFSRGIAVIAGKVWHRQDKKDYHLIELDADKKEAITEICTRDGRTISLQDMAQRTLVEQHADCLDRAHFYFYSPIPFPKKSADSVLGLEVKGSGDHGLMFCSPSMQRWLSL
ncbi:MAG TPA: bifunctional DNA primase/polymerase [Nitrososphaeraceae archaeon]|nr:bifunctional DNA primase/polymerase [Nitrososphaeraceae archaeon]